MPENYVYNPWSKHFLALSLNATLLLSATACSQPTKDGVGNVSELPLAASAPSNAARAQGNSTKDGIDRFVAKGSSIRIKKKGDLDGDGREDVLLVLESTDGDQAKFQPRVLLILKRAPKGDFEKVIENTDAVLCRACGGMMGDPLQSVDIANKGFTLRFEGGSRELWSQEFRFDYSKSRKTWVLASIEESGADRVDGAYGHKRLGKKDFGVLPIAEFNIQDFPASPIP